MIHSKSQKTKRIVPTDDERLFYTRVKLKEEESNSQVNNKEIKDFFQTSPIKKPNLKKDSSYEYKIGNYLIQQTLGQGTFGKVKLGIYIPTQEKVAIKVLEKEKMTDKDDKIRVKREFDMLSKFNHPNVILVTEIFESVDSYYSVMEFCEGGELFNYIVDKKRLSENETSFFYFQIINGLEYIHSLGIVHRDLKPENLLLTKEHLLKIIDFGLSNYFVDGQETLLSTPCGSPCYASPEMVSGKKYNGIKIDIWATGIILFAMLCGYLPFEDKDNEVLFDKILECKIDFPEFLSDESIDLIKKILVVDPEERIDINGIKKHSFFLRGKKFFDQIFTIKQINVDDTENNSINNDNYNDNYNENIKDKNIENDAIEKVDKAEVESIKDENVSDNVNKNDIEININNEKEKENELSENKENINSNIKINKDSTEKDIKNKNNNNNLNINKKEHIDIGENKDNINNTNNMSKDNAEKNLNKENLNDNIKHKKSRDYRKSKDLNRHQQMDKKEKIDITNDNTNYNGYNNKKKLSDLIPKNYNKKLIQKTPENKNPKFIKQKETTIDKTQKLDTVSKERNTYGSIASIGSSLAENLNTMTNQTNTTMNNMNYNVNISFDNTKRTYSHENTKEDMQNEQSKNNTHNTLFQNNLSHNTTSKNSNNINIVDNYLTVDINKNETNNNNNNKNNIYLLNYNNKKYKFNKIRNTNPSKIKKNLKDIRTSKQYLNSDNIRIPKQDLDFNICKFLVNNSHIKKNYKEFLSKKYGGNTISHKKNNETNTINTNSNNILSKNKNPKYDNSYKNNTHNYNSKSNDKKIYNQRTNYLSNYQNGIYNKENNINVINKKSNFKKLQNYKKINFNSNMISKDKIMSKSKNLSIINNNSKNKSKMLMIKSTQLSSKTKTIHKNKRTNKLNNHHFLNQFSMELELNSINNNLETDPNLKKKIKSINKLTKKYRTKVNSKVNSNTENKKLNQNINIKYSMNTLRKLPISNYNNFSNKDNLDSPLKNGKYRQKLTKYHINNPSINSSHKKQFYTINNIVTNYKMYKPDLIATINKTNQKNISRQVKKPIKDEISNKLRDKTTKSIEINKNNKDSFFRIKNEKQNNISGISSIYNLSNNDTLTNYLKNTDRTPSHYKESNLSKNSKNGRSQNSKNQILIICSEADFDYGKNKILKMNKYRNLCLKTNEDLKDINYYKIYRIKGVKKISNINNYKENILRIKKNKTQNNLGCVKHMTFHTSRTHNKNLTIFYMNKKHIKNNSMRISDLYRNNIKNKKKEKKVYLIDKDKTSEDQRKIKKKNKFSVGNKALLPRNIISINNSNNNNDKSIQIKISENSISKKILK